MKKISKFLIMLAFVGLSMGSLWAQNLPASGNISGTYVISGNYTGNYNLTGNVTITVNSGATATMSGVISGGSSSYTLTKAGNGILILTGANTYSGGTSILDAGTLQVGNGTSTTASINSTSGVNIGNALGTLRFEPGGNMVFTKNITGNGKVQFKGGPMNISLTFTGNNTYAGTTTIEPSSRLFIGNGSTAGSITGNIIIEGVGGVTTSGYLLFNRSDTYTYGGIISGTGRVTQASGTTILTGVNTYTGITSVSGGTLQIGNGTNGSINNTSEVNISSSATLSFHPGANMIFSAPISGDGKVEYQGSTTKRLYFTGTNTYQGTTTIIGSSSDFYIGNNTTTGSVAGNIIVNSSAYLNFNRSNDYTYPGVISGAGLVYKYASGKTILTGTNTYTGGTYVTDGILQIGNGTTGSIPSTSTATLSVSANATLRFEPGADLTFSRVISGQGNVAKGGTNMLRFTGENTYQGTTTIDQGRLDIGNNTPTGSIQGNIIINGGALGFNRSNTYTYSKVISGTTGDIFIYGTKVILTGENTFTGKITIQAGVLQVGEGSGSTGSINSDVDIRNNCTLRFEPGSNMVYSKVISNGGGSVGKVEYSGNSTRTLTFTGNNTYTGTTTVVGDFYIGNGGTTGSVAGNIILGDNAWLFFNRSNDYTYSGVISGTTTPGRITKQGSGKTILTGTNTFSGAIYVQAGTLQIGYGSSGSIPSTGTAAVSVLSGATLRFEPPGVWTFSRVINGAGNVVYKGGVSRDLILTGVNTYQGSTTVEDGILQIGNGTSGSINNTSGVTLTASTSIIHFMPGADMVFSKPIIGQGKVEYTGNMSKPLTFTGENTYAGTTTINEGSFSIGNGGTTGSVSGDIILGNDPTGTLLVFNRSNEYTYSGKISGPCGVYHWGTGKTILTGNSSYTGPTMVIYGTLQVGNGIITTTSINSTSLVDINPGTTLCFQPGATMTFAKPIHGAGNVAIKGTNTVVFTADNDYNGTTTIDPGATLSIGYSTSTGAIAGDIINNGTLRFYRSNAYTYSKQISGTGNVYQWSYISSSVLTLTGANTYTGVTYIDGPLVLGASGTIANSSSVTFETYADAKLTITGNKTIKALNSSSTNAGTVDLGANTLTIGTSGQSDGSGTFRGVFAGTGGGSVTKNGTGTFTFTGTNNTATGLFDCNQGTVVLEGNWAGSFIKNSGSTLTVIGNRTIGGVLGMEGGTTNFNLSGSTPSRLSASGALGKSGTNTLNITAVGSESYYVLISAASGNSNTNNFTVTGVNGTLSATGTELRFTPAPVHIPVTDITGVATTATATLPLTLAGTVVPSDATNKTITWSVSNANGTGATITGNTLNTTSNGQCIVRATIVNGLSPTQNYTKDFNITINKATLGGTVTVTGSTVFGQTLTALTTGLNSTPTIPNLGTLSYQWQRGTSNITGATASTYTLVQADIGSTIRVLVTAANCTGTVTSANSAPVTKAPQTAPAAPSELTVTSNSITLNTVSGCEYNRSGGAYQDQTLFSGLTPNTSYPFTQRLKETATHLASPASPTANISTSGIEFVPVTNITGVPTTATATLPLTLTGTVVPNNATNQTIVWSVQSSATGATITGGNILNNTSNGSAVILATIVNGTSPTQNYTQTCDILVKLAVLSGSVTVTGNTVFGQTLTAVTTGLTSNPVIPDLGTVSYQWQRGTTDISGATSSTYTLVQADIGSTIRVLVNAANCESTVISANTATVTKATQTAPAAPTMLSNTSNSITLNTVTGCEYNINGGTWQDPTLFSGLTPSTSYTFTQRLKETATHLASPASPSASFSTTALEHIPVTGITGVPTTATATLPLTLTGTVVPSNATNQTIVWSVQSAGTTGANITGGNILNTNAAGTATILATIASGTSPTQNYTQTFTITVNLAALGGTVTVTGNTVFGQTLTAVTTGLSSTPTISNLGTLSYQWQRGTTNISGATTSTYTLVQADINNTIRVVVTAANCSGNVTSANTATVTKATQTAPAAPTMLSNTSNSITLNTLSGCEYNRDGGNYQTSPAFTGLTPSTSYNFTQRLAETATHLASPASPTASFSTTAPEHIPVTNITGIPTTATATLPLTLTGTVVPSNATNQTIVWSVQSAGTTGANITGGNILNTNAAGTATILATITNGTSPTQNYTQTFTITVSLATLGGTVTVTGNTVFGETLTAVTTGLASNPTISNLGTLSYQWQRGTTNISGATSSTYTLVQADIGNTIRVQVTAANCSGNVTSANSTTVTKATQTAPAAPTMQSNTSNSITLNTLSGGEYNIGGGSYQSSPAFTGLTPSTSYSFTQRLAETATHLASPASPAASFSTTTATLAGTVTITGNTVFGETLTANTTGLTSDPVIPDLGALSYQWRRGTTNITGATNVTYTLVQEDIGQQINVQVTATNCEGTVTSANSAAVTKAEQTAPAAPTMLSNTSNSITLNTVTGCEYSMNEGTWQTSPEFAGLAPNTSYSFTQRLAETATHLASEPSVSVEFSTNEDGITENIFNGVKVYSHQQTVYIINEGNVSLKGVEIMDMLGRIVYDGIVTDTETAIRLQVPNAIYVVRLLSEENKTMHTKVSINR